MDDADAKKGRRELASEARQKLLMDAAIKCFAEKGIARTSMRDIAAQAGVSIGNLYNHFPGRDDLIAEIAKMEKEGVTEIIEAVAACTHRRRAVETFVTAYFTYCAEPISAVLTIEITSEALRNPAIGGLFSGTRDMLVSCLTDAIALGEPKPSHADAKRHHEMAGMVIDTIEAFAVRLGLGGKRPGKRERDMLLSFINRALSDDLAR
ncbi:TetR/AcrR family transcriptional regulator [Litoreibacter roseus]|uniref:HTH tetR-type domain-containing protein n=1 Tax=Litoreibacter roseus TaxID=2601869 RepID=A0A6N6JDW3_9RHOB|nr:TetR/AcrR family transcriptional regulator [Litoreibacter roseus]GFE64523.1 hypothetical protein KIN_15970 [Litoreibacter roseus]